METKQDIWGHCLVFWETLIGVFHYFQTFHRLELAGKCNIWLKTVVRDFSMRNTVMCVYVCRFVALFLHIKLHSSFIHSSTLLSTLIFTWYSFFSTTKMSLECFSKFLKSKKKRTVVLLGSANKCRCFISSFLHDAWWETWSWSTQAPEGIIIIMWFYALLMSPRVSTGGTSLSSRCLVSGKNKGKHAQIETWRTHECIWHFWSVTGKRALLRADRRDQHEHKWHISLFSAAT